MNIVCYRVKMDCLLLNWTLWKDFGNSSYTLVASDMRTGEEHLFDVKLFAPHWMVEEQILLAALEHVKRPINPWITLEPRVANDKPAFLDMP